MRTIFIGDVHGCVDELRELLDLLEIRSSDSTVFLGDLVDRGPDPVGCVRLARALPRARGILGNHEEKATRWRRHEAKKASQPGYKNPMKGPRPERQAQWEALSADDVAYLSALPPHLVETVGDETWLAIHGGLVPGIPFAKQPVDSVIRCRWVNPVTGKNVPMQKGSKARPPGAVDWMSAYDGDSHVVCGHAVHSLVEPLVTNTPKGFEVWSIDTGCCFGGHLTALVLDSDRPQDRYVVQVKAREEYLPLERDDGD